MEELASHGYIIFSIGHPGEGIENYPDGSSRYLDLKKCSEIFDKFEWIDQEYSTYGRWAEEHLTSDTTKHKERLFSLFHDPDINRHLREWRKDGLFILNQLESLDNDIIPSPFASRMDLDNIGALGTSFGGAMAIELGRLDDRIKQLPIWTVRYSVNPSNTPLLYQSC